MQRGLAPIVLILGVVLIAIILAIFIFTTKPQTPTSATPVSTPTTATKDETENWKTYTDPKLGFSVKYPPEDSIINPTDEPNTVNIINENATYYGTIFTVYENPKLLSLQSWLKENSYKIVETYSDKNGDKAISPTEKDVRLIPFKVAGQEAVKLEFIENNAFCKNTNSTCESEIYIQYPDNKKIMTITHYQENMISTFQFTQ